MKSTVSIVIPTRNEEENIGILIDSLKGYNHEIIIVDDSDTPRTIEIANERGATIVFGKSKGLGQAIIDGINASESDVVLVMDADLSHNPIYINSMLNPILCQGYDMTIGSRYVLGGGTEGWTKRRILISKVASMLGYPISFIKDNTSGFFAFRKEIINGINIKPSSWKIMLEILVKANPTAVKEIPINFSDRTAGKSKFNKKEITAYLKHLLQLALHRYGRFINFCFVGAFGAISYFLIFYWITEAFDIWYGLSYFIATAYAILQNYIINHFYTFRHIKNRNKNHIKGFAKYFGGSWAGEAIEYIIMVLFVEVFGFWYIAADLIGAVFSAIVKYIFFKKNVWHDKPNPSDPDYEWNAFFKGGLIQKWWKKSIANTVWDWIPPENKLLDIGCGSSPIITEFQNATGIDINKNKIEFMLNKLPYIQFSTRRVFDLKEQFDNIICIEVLEHLPNPHNTIAGISRLLKSGGIAIIATPDYKRPLWRIAEMFTPYKEEHITKFTREKLEYMCEEYGLYPVKHKYIATCDLVEAFEKC